MIRPSNRLFIAKLGALSIFFSTIEYLFPRPVPFFRLGLANAALLLSLEFLNPGEYLVLLILKVLGQGLINGTFASYVFLFSLAGTFSSGWLMFLLHRAGGRHISLMGVSIAGAMASSMTQLVLSVYFVFGEKSWLMMPWFTLSSLGTGLLIGWFSNRFQRESRWLEQQRVL